MAPDTHKRPVTAVAAPSWHERLGIVGDALYRARLVEGVREPDAIGELSWRRRKGDSVPVLLAEADRALQDFEDALEALEPRGRKRPPASCWEALQGRARIYAGWAERCGTDLAPRLRAIAERRQPS
jgi:hypothetical protein